MTKTPDIEIRLLEASEPLFDAVIRLYRKDSSTLGFLPRGAFEQCADDGCILVAHVGGEVAGYVAFRLAKRHAVLVHLCVAAARRGRGLGKKLVQEMLRETAGVPEVRISCRRDYPVNELWPTCGFVNAGERPGRGNDRSPLSLWRRLNEDVKPLLSRSREEERGDRARVAIDANVFMDFDSNEEAARESKCLLADWLEPEIELCVTAELSTELDRHDDAALRARRRSQMTAYHTLEAIGAVLDQTLPKVEAILPPAATPSDHSDRRQLAQAIVGGAAFFVTRDERLLRHAHPLEAEFEIRVVRPVDLVGQIHGQIDPDSYAPARLAGTRMQVQAPASEAQMLPFQLFGESEPKNDFLALCRRVLAEPSRYRPRLFSPPGEQPIFLCAVDCHAAPASLRIVLARSLSHRLTPTVVRRVLAEELLLVERAGVSQLWCDEFADPHVKRALLDLGFAPAQNGLLKISISGLVTVAELPSIVPSPAGSLAAPSSPSECRHAERTYWPLKLSDASLPSFIVPIRPAWAAQLFDAALAEQELFGPDIGLALALENVYYSNSPVHICDGARILWYVSKGRTRKGSWQGPGEIRACSLAGGTVRGPARTVFRDHRRLGVFQWPDVLRLADGEPCGEITAYRFAFTERCRSPVSFARAQEVLHDHKGSGSQFNGPTPISPAIFNAIYTEAGLAES